MDEERVRQADAELLENLFVQYRNKMYAVAFAILNNQHQAEDAVGDAYEKLIPYLGKCREMGEVQRKALLTRFVKNSAIDIYRRNKREQGNVPMDEHEWLTDAYKPIEAYMKSLQYGELIQKVREILPVHYWDVIRLRYYEGMPVQEIALRLNLSEENVYTRLRRAKNKVRSVIGDDMDEE